MRCARDRLALGKPGLAGDGAGLGGRLKRVADPHRRRHLWHSMAHPAEMQAKPPRSFFTSGGSLRRSPRRGGDGCRPGGLSR
jgi:hypothetical protein